VLSATLAFVLLTLGAVADPVAFVTDIAYERQHYAEGHWAYSVTPGASHARAMLEYLAFCGLSPYPALAVTLFALAVFGVTRLGNRRLGLLLIGFPIVYVAFFTPHRVMIVRNLLVTLPFLSILAARGLASLAEAIGGRVRSRGPLIVITAALAVVHLTYEARAAISIYASLDAFVREFVVEAERGVDSHMMSPGLARATARPLDAFAKANRPPPGYFAFLKSEVEHSDVRRWPANRLGVHRVFGPRDVNFDYYPTWRGHDRVIVLRWRDARVLFDLE
jgi:hypothetical protein